MGGSENAIEVSTSETEPIALERNKLGLKKSLSAANDWTKQGD